MSAWSKKDVLAVANAVEQLVYALKVIDVEIASIHLTPENFQKLEYATLKFSDSTKLESINYYNNQIQSVSLVCDYK